MGECLVVLRNFIAHWNFNYALRELFEKCKTQLTGDSKQVIFKSESETRYDQRRIFVALYIFIQKIKPKIIIW